MKIVVAGTRGFPGVQGGVENHCENLYTHLAKKGCQIIVFTRKPYVDVNLLTYKGISLVPINCFNNKFLEAIFHTFKSVIKARSLKPHILHIHAIGPSLFVPLGRILGMKVVITNHGPDYQRKKWPPAAKVFLKFCERVGMMFANEVIAISDNIADDLKRKYGRNVAVIPNGVEIPLLTDTDEYLSEHGLWKNKYILSVGRIVPEKGFHDLIDAFCLMQSSAKGSQISDWKLVIVGDADHKDKYSRMLKEKGQRNKRIILAGFLTGKSLHELYTHAGIFVLPSYHEGLPIVLLEALSYGLSCITSDIQANRNIGLSEDRYFRAGDITLLSEKMEEFIGKAWDIKDRQKQQILINEKYNWEKISNETLTIYKRALLRDSPLMRNRN